MEKLFFNNLTKKVEVITHEVKYFKPFLVLNLRIMV